MFDGIPTGPRWFPGSDDTLNDALNDPEQAERDVPPPVVVGVNPFVAVTPPPTLLVSELPLERTSTPTAPAPPAQSELPHGTEPIPWRFQGLQDFFRHVIFVGSLGRLFFDLIKYGDSVVGLSPTRTGVAKTYLMGYTNLVKQIRQTEVYAKWFGRLRDRQARARILARIRRLSLGNPGDVAPVGEGVLEIRIHYGPGYRVYYVERGQELVVLLAGGDKRSQKRDIRRAIELAKEL